MARIREHLSRAPIAEALIDFRVKLGTETGLNAVKAVARALVGQYEQQSPIYEVQAKVTVSPQDGPHADSSSRELGVRLHSKDARYVLQVRTNGFTLSRLSPYENWDSLMAEAQSLWKAYFGTIDVEAVTRVATRFINNLNLPMKAGERFEQYLTKPPQVPDELPQGVLGFMQRMVVVEPKSQLLANVIQLLQEGVTPRDHVPVILDIDVYKPVVMQPDSDEMWRLLQELRGFKNAVFFASLTEATIGLYE